MCTSHEAHLWLNFTLIYISSIIQLYRHKNKQTNTSKENLLKEAKTCILSWVCVYVCVCHKSFTQQNLMQWNFGFDVFPTSAKRNLIKSLHRTEPPWPEELEALVSPLHHQHCHYEVITSLPVPPTQLWSILLPETPPTPPTHHHFYSYHYQLFLPLPITMATITSPTTVIAKTTIHHSYYLEPLHIVTYTIHKTHHYHQHYHS